MINYGDPQTIVGKYKVTLEPFLHRLQIKGRFEVVAPYEMPPQTLFAKISLPNQQVEDVELIPSGGESCEAEKDEKDECRVYRFSQFLMVSSDKHLSREIREYERIPIKISFDLNSRNWSLFKSINGITNAHNRGYINFISRLKMVELDNHFLYKNSFGISRDKYESPKKHVDIPVMWTTDERKNSRVITSRINLNLRNLDEISYGSIRELFSIEHINGLEVLHEGSRITLPSGLEIDMPRPEKRVVGGKSTFYVSEGLSKTKDGTYLNDPFSNEISFLEKGEGFIKHKLTLRLNNGVFPVYLRNYYSFKRDRISEPLRRWKIVVVGRDDNRFEHLHRFNQIDI